MCGIVESYHLRIIRTSRTMAIMLAVILFLQYDGKCDMPEISVSEVIRESKKLICIENAYYVMTLAPELARLPLSLILKETGHEFFAHPEPLSVKNEGFRFYGGLVDALPWVDGIRGNPDYPEKGKLYSSAWTWEIHRNDATISVTAETAFDYADPATAQPSRLAFRKEIIAHRGSLRIDMRYRITNIGDQAARFVFAAHARTAINGYQGGDYFHAPGNSCYIFKAEHPQLEKRLASEGKSIIGWHSWPIDEATVFHPKSEKSFLFAFLPAPWCAVGSPSSGEALLFAGGNMRIGETEEPLVMGVFMGNSQYLVEPAVACNLSAQPAQWTRMNPRGSVEIEPGKTCAFDIGMIPLHGIQRAGVQRMAMPENDYAVMTDSAPGGKLGGEGMNQHWFFFSEGTLEVVGDAETKTWKTKPGAVSLRALPGIETFLQSPGVLRFRLRCGAESILFSWGRKCVNDSASQAAVDGFNQVPLASDGRVY